LIINAFLLKAFFNVAGDPFLKIKCVTESRF
jgi:hypothetical protein